MQRTRCRKGLCRSHSGPVQLAFDKRERRAEDEAGDLDEPSMLSKEFGVYAACSGRLGLGVKGQTD